MSSSPFQGETLADNLRTSHKTMYSSSVINEACNELGPKRIVFQIRCCVVHIFFLGAPYTLSLMCNTYSISIK